MKMLPAIVEINTDDLAERKLNSGTLQYFYNKFTRSFLLKNASGFIFVTQELKKSKSFLSFSQPYLVSGNYLDLTKVPVLPPTNNETPRLVFIGTPGQIWHGIDKLKYLATQFPEWHFDIIGPSVSEISDVPNNVEFHGLLKYHQYVEIFKRSDCAIGTLALHRKGMQEASPLKITEYLAHGLPTIIGFSLSNAPKDNPFLLELPNSENNISGNLSLIRNFVLRWLNKRIDRKKLSFIDATIFEKQRLDFFIRIIEGKSN